MATFGNTEFDLPETTGYDNAPLLDPTPRDTPDPGDYNPDFDVEPDDQVDTTYKPPEEYKPSGDALVENRMTGLLDSGSRYVEMARQRGKEYAHSRGLLNSSIAAGATERAAIESALPIAAQDAGATHEAGMTGYRGEIEGALIGKQAAESSWLSAQESRQARKIETMQQTGAKERLQMEIDAQKDMENLSLSSSEKDTATRLFQATGDTYSEQLRLVQSDPSISGESKTQVVADLRAQYEQNMRVISSVYGIEIDWPTDENTDTGTDTGGGSATGDPKFPRYLEIQTEITNLKDRLKNMSSKSLDQGHGSTIERKIRELEEELKTLAEPSQIIDRIIKNKRI